ncbi:MAG TPA: SLC13 family permease [Acidobacteriota bacterium]|nr:SLC13 family permease [Acidobacteriota bacterium]
MKRSKWIGLATAITAAVVIVALPTPASLMPSAQAILAASVFTIILWFFQVVNNGIASILMMGLMIVMGVSPQLALSGYSSPQFWILVCVLYYGCVMHHTGLAQRLSYYVLSLFPVTYNGILASFFVIGLVLAFGVPSMTVRTAIMVPIAWALVKSLEIPPRSRGSALIILTAVQMAVIPGLAVLYGSLFGPFVESVFHSRGFSLGWMEYAKVMTVPTLVLCGLILLVNPLVLKPEKKIATSHLFARERLKSLGVITRGEWITAAVVALSILYWATDRVHGMPSFLVGMFGMSVFALAGILRDEDIGAGVSWTLLLFIGGIFGLSNIIQEYRITDWLAGYFMPVAETFSSNELVFLVMMAVVFLLLRFFDPTGFIIIPVLFLPVSSLVTLSGIPPLVLAAPLLLATSPFWLSYQNFWIAMGEGMTANQAFTAGQRTRLANVYGAMVPVTLVVSFGYWKLIGLL